MPARTWSETPFASKEAFLRYSRRKFALKNKKKRDRNFARKSALRTILRRTESAIAAGDMQQAQELYRQAASQLDKAVGKGVIKRNAANRKKSRLARRINKIAAA